jgi:hypothetical protein
MCEQKRESAIGCSTTHASYCCSDTKLDGSLRSFQPVRYQKLFFLLHTNFSIFLSRIVTVPRTSGHFLWGQSIPQKVCLEWGLFVKKRKNALCNAGLCSRIPGFTPFTALFSPPFSIVLEIIDAITSITSTSSFLASLCRIDPSACNLISLSSPHPAPICQHIFFCIKSVVVYRFT